MQLLSRLDGATVPLAEGVYLARATRVTDVARVIDRLQAHGILDRATLEGAMSFTHPPVAITRELLAAARRDLKALDAPATLALARESRRALSRYGVIDRAWIAEREEKLQALAAVVASPPIGMATPDPDVARRARALREASSLPAAGWFERVLEIVGLVHGGESAAALARARDRLTALGAQRRQHARARIGALLQALETGVAPLEADLAPLAVRLERAGELPGRARRSRALEVLRQALAWPDAPAALGVELADRAQPFAAALRKVGEALVQALPAPRDPRLRERTLGMLAFYGLTFAVGADGVPMLSASDIDTAIAKQAESAKVAGTGLTLAQALAVVELPLADYARQRVAAWIADGLELDLVARACKEGHAEAIARAPSGRAAKAFATWAARLVPHYRALGITFKLSPDIFTHLPRNEDAAVLAVCLLEQAKEGARNKTSDPIALLDATLGLFAKLPAKARGILDRLRGTSDGAGRRAFPELAAWLDDDALLDRFVHVSRLAAVPVALSRQLGEDFEHEAKTRRERAHLAALPNRHARQEARLALLSASERAQHSTPRKRTRRRLGERIEELLPLAYRRELDAVFREILREAWGISVPAMTEAWRDAVRFWLVVDDNRDLLGLLLREAVGAPGRSVTLAFPRNRAWLEQVGGRVSTAAWLAARRVSFSSGDARFELAFEEDPLEVLRMGIPFATCLSLEDGCNAASTVLNAIDANKRVLYVRNREGKVVARKLLAISKDLRLVGYNLYVSVTGEAERAIRAAVEAFGRVVAEAVGAPLFASGVPQTIHQGFWYDDGTVPWGDDVDVAAYCRALDLTAPAKWFDSLATEARGRRAMDAGDVEAALATLTRWDSGPANAALGAWLLEQLGEREALRRGRDHLAIAATLVRAQAARDEAGLLRALATAARLGEAVTRYALSELIRGYPRSARIAAALGELASRATFDDDHDGFMHFTFDELPSRLEGVEASLAVLDGIEAPWQRYTERNRACTRCRENAERECIVAIASSYAACAEPESVVACLTSRHRTELAQRAALAIAARHVLPGGARALLRSATLQPRLARSPEMLAAHLRQRALTQVGPRQELPVPATAPFEVLGELLFSCDGVATLVAGFPKLGRFGEPDAADAWSPGPWELAWFRRQPSSHVHTALFSIAALRPTATSRALELLAQLGAREHLEELRKRADSTRGARTAVTLEPAEHLETAAEAMEIARAVEAQTAAVAEGRLPVPLGRLDAVDRALLAVAEGVLTKGAAEAAQREAALAVVLAWPSLPTDAWERLLRALTRDRDAAALTKLLDAKVGQNDRQLGPHHVAALWSVEAARSSIAAALARACSDSWCAYVTACERAASPRALDGLFEAAALAVLEGGAAASAVETESLDQLRIVIRLATADASPLKAAELYEALSDDLSASLFVKAVRRLPRDRAAAVREAVGKLRFQGPRGEARKAWLLATRPLKKKRASSIERG